MTTPTRISASTINIVANGVVMAAVFSGFTQALGVLMASAELGVAALGQPPTPKGIIDLRSIYGSSVVDEALELTGKDVDIVSLAYAVEGIAIQKLREKYGDNATDKAIDSCGITEYACVEMMARSLHGLEQTGNYTVVKIEEATAVSKRRGKQKAQPVKDTKTGIVYSSKAKAGMAVAADYGLDPKNHFIWYEVVKKDPGRFVRT